MKIYAHTTANGPETWEPLEVHLENVAKLAAEFANKFGAEPWGRLAGLWHDLGKYSAEFQARLHGMCGSEAHLEEKHSEKAQRVDHSTAGARHAMQSMPREGLILAFVIAGHHAGLADFHSSLSSRLNTENLIPDWSAAPLPVVSALPLVPPPFFWSRDDSRSSFQVSLFARMLFSCLVDADFLATEGFLRGDAVAERATQVAIAELAPILDRKLELLAAENAARSSSTVNDARQEVLEACRCAADAPPGLFSLTVPTGGGKTLASLAFALRHAACNAEHGFRRVIMAIPFTSIIEQTANVYREVFQELGEQAVLEHRSNLDVDDPRRQTAWSRLAAENWDAPLVVTTNVQFFESFFAVRTSCCRKLHNVARSVLIFDEVQSLPVEQLEPCLELLRELVTNYGCTVVLCTATQPAIDHRAEFPIGLQGVKEIVPAPSTLYERLKRVKTRSLGRQSDEGIAERLAEEKQVLCIVNTRPHAARLFALLRDRLGHGAEGLFHLSTLMCGAHRQSTLKQIRRRLTDGAPCRVVSTQLIEAGVDVDFPAVYRALTGFDALAQAAGRCNRNGRQERGAFYVFEPEEVSLPGLLRQTALLAAELLPTVNDPLELAALRKYFEHHFWKAEGLWNDRRKGKESVLSYLSSPKCEFQFRQAEERFKLIDDQGKPIIVPWKSAGRKLVARLSRTEPPDWRVQRKLQRYTVNVYDRVLAELRKNGDVKEYHEQYCVLENSACYDSHFGLSTQKSGIFDPHDRIA